MVVTLLGRILSIILSIYAILVVALVTGVIVAFYNDLVSMKYKAGKAEILDKLEHLQDLPKEELADLSDAIKNHNNNMQKSFALYPAQAIWCQKVQFLGDKQENNLCCL